MNGKFNKSLAHPIYTQDLKTHAFDIIDVRDPSDYASLHIPNTKNITDFSHLTQTILENPQTKFLLHCYSGYTVALYGSHIVNMGAQNVYYFDGSFEEIYQAITNNGAYKA